MTERQALICFWLLGILTGACVGAPLGIVALRSWEATHPHTPDCSSIFIQPRKGFRL